MLDSIRSRVATVRERVGNAINVALGGTPRIGLDMLPEWPGFGFGGGAYVPRVHDGEKYPGGFGPTELLTFDYWTLRQRSAQLYETNLYARGLVRRIVTNEITSGLHLEATPREKLLGRAEDELSEWSEEVETRFELWQDDAWLCDHSEQLTFGQLQVQARIESIVEGDVLVVLRQNQSTGLPRVQLIKGGNVQTPIMSNLKLRDGHRVVHGVELNAFDRQVAYYVTQRDGTSKRLPAYGEKSGRRLAWLVYGSDKRLDDVRGKPLLGLVMQSLREIDRYRDSTQRKAVINSMLATFVKRGEAKGTSPMLAGAVRKGTAAAGAGPGPAAAPRRFNVAELIPGLVLDELAPGEEPVAFPSHGTDEKFGAFEAAILQTIAWSFEIPPEILLLSFSSNYSASQAAINELKLYLHKSRWLFGTSFCQPIYQEWLVAMALVGKVDAAEMIDAWRDSKRYDVFTSWVNADWTGNIKPSMNPVDQAKAYDMMVASGACTRDRMAREMTGTKFTQNVKKLRIENEQLARALEPILKLQALMTALGKGGDDDSGKPGETKGESQREKEAEAATDHLRAA
jgi:lambda family phage portal protein